MVWVNIAATVVVAGIGVWVLRARSARKGQLDAALWKPFLTASPWVNYLLPGLRRDAQGRRHLDRDRRASSGSCSASGGCRRRGSCAPCSGGVVEFFRAVPVLLMMIFFYLGLGQLQILEPSDVPLVAVVLGLTFYNGSVFAELIRSGVHGLPRGSAGGGARRRAARRPVAAARSRSRRRSSRCCPAIASQLVVILKDTALGVIITYPELLDAARRFGSGNGNILQALVVAALIFIVINYALTQLAELLAGRVGTPDRRASRGPRRRRLVAAIGEATSQPAVALARISRTTVTLISPG